MKRWTTEATEPLAHEVDALLPQALPHADELRRASEPMQAEIDNLLAQRGAPVLSPGPRWASPMWVLVPALAALVLWLGWPGTGFEVVGDGAYTVRESASGPVIAHHQGRLTYDVDPRRRGQTFVVRAGDVEVTVVGTRFTVHEVDSLATVSVEHGRVEVRHDAMLAVLVAGERWTEPPETARIETLATGPDRMHRVRREITIDGPGPTAPTQASPLLPVRAEDRAARFAAMLRRFETGERSDDLRQALEVFTRTSDLLTFPARVLEVEIQAALGLDTAHRDLRALLDQGGHFPGRLDLLLLAGDVAREHGRCVLAHVDYAEALPLAGRRRPEVRVRQAFCEIAAGRFGIAETLLVQALDGELPAGLRRQAEQALGLQAGH